MKQPTWILLLPVIVAGGCAQTASHTVSLPTEDSTSLREVVDSPEPGTIAPAAADSAAGVGWRPTSFTQPIDSAAASAAEDSESLTLDVVEQIALSSNPTLAELQGRVDSAEGRWLQVGLNPNPRAGVGAQEIGNENSAGQYGAFVSQEFVTANKLELNREAAAWEVRRAEKRLEAQRLRVLTDVRRSFYSVLVAQERVRIAQELHSIAAQAVERAAQLVKEQEPKRVLTQAEIEVELVSVLVQNSQTQRDAQWRILSTVVGQPDMPRRTITGDLSAAAPQIAWEEALDRIRRESPELAASSADVEQTRWALERASVQATPNLTIQTGVYYDDGSRDPFASLQMSLPIPVYDQNQGGVAEAQANVVSAELAVQRVELSLQQRLAAVFQRYEQARQQAERYDQTILEKARENLDLNRQAFDAGESAYLPVLTAQRSYSQAKLAWLNAVEQLWLASVEIEGLLLSRSLDPPEAD